MNCHKCHVGYNLNSNIPILFKNNKSICLQCFKLCADGSIPPLVNQSLFMKVQKFCKIHPSVTKSVYSVSQDKFYCEQCLIYDPNMKKVIVSEQLIETKEIQNLQKETIQKINKCCEAIKTNTSKMVSTKRQQVLSKGLIIIQQKYQQISNSLNEAKVTAQNQLIQAINGVEKNFKNSEEFKSFHKLLFNKEKINSKTTLKQAKQYLVQIQKVQDELKIVQQNSNTQLNRILDQQLFPVTLLNDKLQISFTLSEEDNQKNVPVLLETNRQKEEMLLDLEISEKEKVEWFKFQEQQETQIDSNRSITSQLPSLSTSRISSCSKITPFQKKSTLSLRTSVLPKVSSAVKQVKACELNLGSVEAKKLIKELNETFVARLDLSYNRLTSNFIIGLNKKQMGKYLKQITVSNNNIEKSPTIAKKIQLLEKQGLKIIL